jgi:hypothetical protein
MMMILVKYKKGGKEECRLAKTQQKNQEYKYKIILKIQIKSDLNNYLNRIFYIELFSLLFNYYMKIIFNRRNFIKLS